MKQTIPILFIFLSSGTSGFTQVKSPVKKAYAYKQASIPGIVSNLPEDKAERKQNYTYWFYLSIPKTEKIIVTGLWIDGKQYDLKSETVTNLPVRKIVYTGLEKNDTTIMVPATNNKIILVYPVSIKSINSTYALNLAKANELVIRYIWKGKTQYTSNRKIKELTPDVRV